MFINIETIKSIKPISISEEVYNFVVASVNSFAIKLAIVCPGENILSGILLEFPITIVTAIVSPKALPKERRKPAKIPLKENGRVTDLRVSNSVAPKEIAPSFYFSWNH